MSKKMNLLFISEYKNNFTKLVPQFLKQELKTLILI